MSEPTVTINGRTENEWNNEGPGSVVIQASGTASASGTTDYSEESSGDSGFDANEDLETESYSVSVAGYLLSAVPRMGYRFVGWNNLFADWHYHVSSVIHSDNSFFQRHGIERPDPVDERSTGMFKTATDQIFSTSNPLGYPSSEIGAWGDIEDGPFHYFGNTSTGYLVNLPRGTLGTANDAALVVSSDIQSSRNPERTNHGHWYPSETVTTEWDWQPVSLNAVFLPLNVSAEYYARRPGVSSPVYLGGRQYDFSNATDATGATFTIPTMDVYTDSRQAYVNAKYAFTRHWQLGSGGDKFVEGDTVNLYHIIDQLEAPDSRGVTHVKFYAMFKPCSGLPLRSSEGTLFYSSGSPATLMRDGDAGA